MPVVSDPTEAQRLVEEGRAYSDAGDNAAAERAYLAAIALEPAWPIALYNLGLLYKYQGRWEESLRFNRRASELAILDRWLETSSLADLVTWYAIDR